MSDESPLALERVSEGVERRVMIRGAIDVEKTEAECRLCDHVESGDEWASVFDELEAHGLEEHDWDGERWSP